MKEQKILNINYIIKESHFQIVLKEKRKKRKLILFHKIKYFLASLVKQLLQF
jgi:hypothetical protein